MDIKDSVRSKGEQERNVFSKNEMETTALRQERKKINVDYFKAKIVVSTFFSKHWSVSSKNAPIMYILRN